VADGTTVDVGVLPAAEGPPRRTLVLGPSSSGKSAAAERLLAAEPTVVYAATAATAPGDPEWVRRIADHRSRRPRRWSTLERPDLVRLMSEPGPPALVDSVGSWLTGVLDANGAWDDAIGWRERTLEEVDRVVEAWAGAQRTLVAVGEEVGWGVVPATPAGRVFRDVLGRANQLLAARSEQVLLVVAGRVLDLAPSPGAAGAWP
jgi:adenosylcobinamide kinase/adenosylcobinamide-phosphate guanylyltransferase